MISIIRAEEKDVETIVHIGNISVADAHRASCSAEDLAIYLNGHYSDSAIKEELRNTQNIYHILYHNGQSAGFSKIVLNAEHPNISKKNVTKLDRIYLLKDFQELKLGYELLKFNIDLAKKNEQSGVWLFTWTGNTKAVNFYLRAGFKIIGSHLFKVSETHSNDNHQMFLDITGDRDDE